MEAATETSTDLNNSPTMSGGDEIMMNSPRLIDYFTRKPDLATTLPPLGVLALCGANLATIQKVHAIKPSALTLDLFVDLCKEGVSEEILDFLAKHLTVDETAITENGTFASCSHNCQIFKIHALDTQNKLAVQKILSTPSLTRVSIYFNNLYLANEVEIMSRYLSVIFDNKSILDFQFCFPKKEKVQDTLARVVEQGHCNVESLVISRGFCSNLELVDKLLNNLPNLKHVIVSTNKLCVKSISLLSQLMALNKLERFGLKKIHKVGRRGFDDWPALTPLFSPLSNNKKLRRLVLFSLGKQAFEACTQQLAQILKYDNTTITEVIVRERASELLTESQCLLIRRCSGRDPDLPVSKRQFTLDTTTNFYGRGNARDPTRPLADLVNNLISVNNNPHYLIPDDAFRVNVLFELLRQLPSKWTCDLSVAVPSAATAVAATVTDAARESPGGVTTNSSPTPTTTTTTATTSRQKSSRKRTASPPRRSTRNKRPAIGLRRSTRNKRPASGPPN